MSFDDLQKALQISQARFLALFNNLPTMAVTLDREGKMILVNEACIEQLGYEMEELVGQSVLNLFHQGDREAVFRKLQSCLENQDQVHYWQFRKVTKDGVLLWVEEVVQVVHDLNGELNVLVVCQDVSEQKKLKTEIEEARRYAEVIVETLIEPLVVLNSELIILSANNSFYETFKLPRQKTIGARIYDLAEGDWNLPPLHLLLEEILPEKTVFNGYVLEHEYRGIGSRTLLINARRISREESGHIILLAMEDITERKRAEEEMKRLNRELTERAAELQAVNIELETFNHTVAHDLRQPLDLLSSYCQMLDRLCGSKLDEECLRYVHDTYNVTLQMNKLIRALLEFSLMSRIDLHRSRVDLSLLAQEVFLSLKVSEPQRNVEFRTRKGIMAHCDPNLMRVVLNNLIGNSWKYTAIREKAVIEFDFETRDDAPVYFVKDNGLGFQMADAEKLFAPFRRLPGTEQTKGFGIGLATVERIIRRHGGKVWAEGEPGKCACICFTLPAPAEQNEEL